MTERPILFNAEMVRAILDGRKTVTRRALKMPHGYWETSPSGELVPVPITCPYGQPGDRLFVRETWSDVNLQGAPGVAYRADGDVRDLMADPSFLDQDGAFNYDDKRVKPYSFAAWSEDLLSGVEGRWRPNIHMPRWASRILLEITDVRVERLQEITEEQARTEGVMRDEERPEEHDWRNNGKLCPECAGTGLHSGIGSGGGVIFDIDCRECDTAIKRFKHLWASTGGDWDANPWVWVVDFKRIDP